MISRNHDYAQFAFCYDLSENFAAMETMPQDMYIHTSFVVKQDDPNA